MGYVYLEIISLGVMVQLASLSSRGPSDMEPAVHVEGHLEGSAPPYPRRPARCEGASPKAGVETQPLRLQCFALSLLSCSDQLAGGPKEGRLLSQVRRPALLLERDGDELQQFTWDSHIRPLHGSQLCRGKGACITQ